MYIIQKGLGGGGIGMELWNSTKDYFIPDITPSFLFNLLPNSTFAWSNSLSMYICISLEIEITVEPMCLVRKSSAYS